MKSDNKWPCKASGKQHGGKFDVGFIGCRYQFVAKLRANTPPVVANVQLESGLISRQLAARWFVEEVRIFQFLGWSN